MHHLPHDQPLRKQITVRKQRLSQNQQQNAHRKAKVLFRSFWASCLVARKKLNPSVLTQNVRAVAIDHRITGMVRVTRIDVLTTTETVRIIGKTKSRTIDRTIVVLKKVVNLATTSKMRTSNLQGMRQAIARQIRKENVLTIRAMNAKTKMIRTIKLQMVKGVTSETAVIGNDLTGANEFARKKSPRQPYRKSLIRL